MFYYLLLGVFRQPEDRLNKKRHSRLMRSKHTSPAKGEKSTLHNRYANEVRRRYDFMSIPCFSQSGNNFQHLKSGRAYEGDWRQ